MEILANSSINVINFLQANNSSQINAYLQPVMTAVSNRLYDVYQQTILASPVAKAAVAGVVTALLISYTMNGEEKKQGVSLELPASVKEVSEKVEDLKDQLLESVSAKSSKENSAVVPVSVSQVEGEVSSKEIKQILDAPIAVEDVAEELSVSSVKSVESNLDSEIVEKPDVSVQNNSVLGSILYSLYTGACSFFKACFDGFISLFSFLKSK
jgi:hypothetical protein